MDDEQVVSPTRVPRIGQRLGTRLSDPADRAATAVIAAFTVIYGTGAVGGSISDRFPDSASYWGTASSLGGGNGFGQRPPLYPLFLEIARALGHVFGLSALRVAGLLQILFVPIGLTLAWS